MFFKPCSKQIQKIILATSLIRIARIREPETGTARHRNILPCEIDEATFTLSLDNAIENFASDQPHRCKATGMKFVSRDHQRSKKKKKTSKHGHLHGGRYSTLTSLTSILHEHFFSQVRNLSKFIEIQSVRGSDRRRRR